MSLIGFSPRGRGQSKPITLSPLPLSTGKNHVSSLAFKGTRVILPPLTPLPPPPNGCFKSSDASFSSTKVIKHQPNGTKLNTRPSQAASPSANPSSTETIHFEGKTPITGSYSSARNHPFHVHLYYNSLSNPSDRDITLFPPSSIHDKGTILSSLLFTWLSSFMTRLF